VAVVGSRRESDENLVARLVGGGVDPIRPHPVAASHAGGNDTPGRELPAIDDRCHGAVDLDRLREFRDHPEWLAGEEAVHGDATLVLDLERHVGDTVSVSAEDRRQTGILRGDERWTRVEMQFIPLVDARPRVVCGSELLERLVVHEFTKAEGHLVGTRGKPAAEVLHGRPARPDDAVEREEEFRLLGRGPLRVDDEAVVEEVLFVDVHDRLAEVGRVSPACHGTARHRNLDRAERERIGCHHDVVCPLELEAETARLGGRRIGRHGHVEERAALAQIAAGLMGREDEDRVAGGGVIDARLRGRDALRRAGDRECGDRNLERVIARLR
jgi:hypothetical protein